MEVTTGLTKKFFYDKDNFTTRNRNFMFNIKYYTAYKYLRNCRLYDHVLVYRRKVVDKYRK